MPVLLKISTDGGIVLRMAEDKEKARTGWSGIVYWIFMALLLLFLLWYGLADLRRTPDVREALAHLGYPLYFAYFIGAGKLLAAAAFLYPKSRRLREWAYAGLTIELLSSFASHAIAGDALGMRIAPLIFLAIMTLAYRCDPYRI
jgi:hypothetical protein